MNFIFFFADYCKLLCAYFWLITAICVGACSLQPRKSGAEHFLVNGGQSVTWVSVNKVYTLIQLTYVIRACPDLSREAVF